MNVLESKGLGILSNLSASLANPPNMDLWFRQIHILQKGSLMVPIAFFNPSQSPRLVLQFKPMELCEFGYLHAGGLLLCS